MIKGEQLRQNIISPIQLNSKLASEMIDGISFGMSEYVSLPFDHFCDNYESDLGNLNLLL